jgi:hypothetical protein
MLILVVAVHICLEVTTISHDSLAALLERAFHVIAGSTANVD